MGRMTSIHIMENKIHVWNHQPVSHAYTPVLDGNYWGILPGESWWIAVLLEHYAAGIQVTPWNHTEGALTMLEISAHHALHITHQHLKQLSEDTSWAAFSIFAKAWSVVSASWGKFLAEKLGIRDNSGYKTKTFDEHVQQILKGLHKLKKPESRWI